MKIQVLLLFFLALIASSGNAEVIRVEGGGAATSAMFLPVQEAYQEATGNTLHVTSTTPVRALVALEKGEVDLATAAVPLSEILAQAEKKGVTIAPATLRSSIIGQNHVLVYVNPANPVTKLSKAQLKDIFTGKITNWQDVGGRDAPIVVIWGDSTPGQNSLFSKTILDEEYVTNAAVHATDYDDIRKRIMADPGAIGIDPHGFRMGGVRVVKTPPVTTDIIAITKGAPSQKVQNLLKWISSTFSTLSR